MTFSGSHGVFMFLPFKMLNYAELRLVAEMGEFKSHSMRINVEFASVVQARQTTYKTTCILTCMLHACVII